MKRANPSLKSSPTESVVQLARSHRLELIFWLALLLAASILGFSVGLWADDKQGWQSSLILILFGGVGVFALFGVGFFGILLYQWRAKYKQAIQEAHQFESNHEWYRQVFKEVIGPIPW